MVNELLNDDGTTNEYLHLLVGECENALDGDGTIPGGGGGGNECNPASPNADCDDDDILNKCDTDNPNYSSFDCDGDDVLNGVDACPNTEVLSGQVDPDGDGCWTDPVVDTCTINATDAGCSKYYLEGITGFTEVTTVGLPIFQLFLLGSGDSIGTATIQLSLTGYPVITILLNEGYSLNDYRIVVKDNLDSTEFCQSMNDVPPPSGDEPDAFLEFSETSGFTGNYFVKIETNACP